MMSLFSTFDFFIFYVTFFMVFFFIFSMMFSNFYLNMMKNQFMNIFFKFIGSFFSNLMNFNFSKSSDFLFPSMLMMIFFLNFSSIFPYIFSLTSQPSLVFLFSICIWISIMVISLSFNFKGQFGHFIPEGAPFLLVPTLFLIELVSATIRPVTLMVRLVANILAGHLLIILLSQLVHFFPLTFPMLSVLNMVEIFVSLIQSYIFLTLCSLYYSEI